MTPLDLNDGMDESRFDREFTLDELLKGTDRLRLLAALQALLGEAVHLVDAAGVSVLGAPPPSGALHVPVRGELEALGLLEAAAPEKALHAAASLLELILRAAARYQMAADLHLETVRQDFRELQHRHEALQTSEARYRELAAHLEQRVTEQVRTIDDTRRQLYHAEKLAAVGQLAAGIAHEINNPIGFISSNLSTAQGYLAKLADIGRGIADPATPLPLQQSWRAHDLDYVLEDFAALLQESLDGAQRVARIVTDLKGFSRVDSTAVAPADINEIIRGVCNVSRSRTEGRIELILALQPLPKLECDAAALGQVFYNLLSNSVQALDGRKGGWMRFASECRGGEIEVTVTDNGPGIAEDILPRIFEPFFTTKDVGQGSGLGLTVCMDVVRAHRGRIDAKNRGDGGAEFVICLPIS